MVTAQHKPTPHVVMGGTCSLLTSGALGGVKGIPTGVFFPGTLAGHAKNASK